MIPRRERPVPAATIVLPPPVPEPEDVAERTEIAS